MTTLELFLLMGYSLLVLAVGYCVILRCRLADRDEELRLRSALLTRAREDVARLTGSCNQLRDEGLGKSRRIQELETRLEKDRQKDASPWARDLPTSQRFEVVQVPVEAVTLRAALDVPEHDLSTLTKADLIGQLRAEVLKQAGEYVEVRKDYYDPCRMCERFVATLRVYRRPSQ